MKMLFVGGKRFNLLATFAVAVLTTSLGLTTARASFTSVTTDSFEVNAASTWSFSHSGTGGGWLESLGEYSRTGNWDAYIYTSSGWSSVGRTVNMGWYPGSAAVEIYLRPYGNNVKVNLEVIDPSNWTYIALKTVTLANSYTYQYVATDWFTVNRPNVFVRVSVLASGTGASSGVDVDDLTVINSAPPR